MKVRQDNQRSIVNAAYTVRLPAISLLFSLGLAASACGPVATQDAAVDDRPNAVGSDATGSDVPGVPNDVPSMANDVPDRDAPTPIADGGALFASAHAVFAAKCGECHTIGRSGGHGIGQMDQNAAFMDSQMMSNIVMPGTIGNAALVRIMNGSMPLGGNCMANPTGPACLTPEQIAVVRSWVEGGQRR